MFPSTYLGVLRLNMSGSRRKKKGEMSCCILLSHDMDWANVDLCVDMDVCALERVLCIYIGIGRRKMGIVLHPS